MTAAVGLSFAEYAQGLGLLAVMALPLVLGARRLRARLLPEFSGPVAWLSDAIIALLALFAVAWLLGTSGALRRFPVAVGCVLVGGVLMVIGRPASERRSDDAEGSPSRTIGIVAMALLALVAAAWVGRLTDVHRAGVTDVDSLIYHLPIAAGFVQDGSITALHHTGNPDAAFFPANGELFQSLTMLPTGTDLLSPLVNLAWLSLAVLAAWCICRRTRAPTIAAAAVGVVLSTPVVLRFSAGTGQVDVAAIALLLVAVALLIESRFEPIPLVLAGAAAGLAIGTKLTVAAVVLTITLGVVVVAPRTMRARSLVAWLSGLVGAGSYWFIVNWVRVGNPLPFISLDLGPISLSKPATPVLDAYGFRIIDYAGESEFWRSVVPDALRLSLGRLWPLLIAAAAAGIILGVLRGPTSLDRLIGVAAIASTVTYVFTPYTALGPPGRPTVAPNIRFLALPLALGLILLWRQERVHRGALAAAYLVVLAVILGSSAPAWAGIRTTGGGAVAAAGLVGIPAIPWLRSKGRRTMLAAVTALVVAGATFGFVAQDRYFLLRYATRGSSGDGLWSWGQDVHGARLAVIGYSELYPFFGADLKNHVRYAGITGAGSEFKRVEHCDEWRRLLHDGRWEFLIAGRALFQNTVEMSPVDLPETLWTKDDPAAEQIGRFGDTSVFKLDPARAPSRCAE